MREEVNRFHRKRKNLPPFWCTSPEYSWSFLPPLLGYLFLKDRGPFIRHHVIESLNFGITMLLLYVVLAISIVGWFLFWVPPIIWTVFRIIAAYRASLGDYYRFPVSLRLIKN
jgi:uncharacterized Tic20 family protein